MKTQLITTILTSFFFFTSFVGIAGFREIEIQKEELDHTFTLSFSSTVVQQEEYALIEAGNDSLFYKEGFPLLPYKTEVITFPFGTKIESIEVTTSDVNVMQLDKKIKLAPKPISANMKSTQVELKEGEIYSSSEPYPSDWYTYNIGAGIDGDEHVIFLSIHAYPCRYIPANNELLYTNEMNIKVSYELPEKPLLQNDEYDLVIVAPSEFSDELQPLVQHKESHGLKTKLVTLDEIYGGTYFASQGRDDAEKVKYFIKNAIEQWGIEYVLLVGSYKKMPVRYAYVIDHIGPYTEGGYISDIYYVDVYDANVSFCSWDSNDNGYYGEYNRKGVYDIVDLYPDAYIGRLACRNGFEVNIMVRKIIEYENTPPEQPWFKRLILCGGDTSPFDRENINEGEYTNERVAENRSDFQAIKLWVSNNQLSTLAIWREIMMGAGFIDFSGHGSSNSWATHPHNDTKTWIGCDIFDIPFYFNGNKLPIIFANACHTAQFNLTYECFGWHFTWKIGGGAIAFIGATGLGYGHSGKASALSLSGYLEIEFFRRYAQNANLGEMFFGAIVSYLNNVPMDDWQDYKTIEEYVILGDPSLVVEGYI